MKIGKPQMLFGAAVTLWLGWQMFRVSQKRHLQTFSGRKQISATATAVLGDQHLWNMVQDYSSAQKTPATAMSAPSR